MSVAANVDDLVVREPENGISAAVSLTAQEAKRLRQMMLQMQDLCARVQWVVAKRNKPYFREFVSDIERMCKEGYDILLAATWENIEAAIVWEDVENHK